MNLLLVMLGAAIGAPLRYLTDQLVRARFDPGFPWGTFIVNTAGSVVLGLLTGALLGTGAAHPLRLLVGVGFCGALTTYSTFSYETLRLAEERSYGYAVTNAVASVAAALGAAFAGVALGQAIWS
ncbi:MAG TPA: fluoride efflux transporter CrcB [Natronosporangium sp.]